MSAKKNPSGDSSTFTTLLEPFDALPESKQDLLRGVLQIFVTKDAHARSDLEKRHRLVALINEYAEEDES